MTQTFLEYLVLVLRREGDPALGRSRKARKVKSRWDAGSKRASL